MQTQERVAPRPELTDLIAILADNKYFLGRRYAEWCSSAPTLESAVAAAAMAQDEIGHARSLYPLLRDLSGEDIEPEHRTEYTNAGFLDQPFEGWTDFVAANFLFDTAMSVLLGASDGSFTPLAQRARRMLEEEHLHWLHGEGWTRRLPRQGQGVRDGLVRSLGEVATDALAWFEVAAPVLLEEGVLLADSEVLRDRFRGRVNPVLASAALPLL
jgi:phenylacetate-CoA oxygenase PaaI subunit